MSKQAFNYRLIYNILNIFVHVFLIFLPYYFFEQSWKALASP